MYCGADAESDDAGSGLPKPARLRVRARLQPLAWLSGGVGYVTWNSFYPYRNLTNEPRIRYKISMLGG